MSSSTIFKLESIQKSLSKAILGLSVSTAHLVVNIELDWKPIGLYIANSKLGYFKRFSDPFFKGSPLVKSCMDWNVSFKASLYMKNLEDSLEMFFHPGGSLGSLKAVHEHHEAMISARASPLL